MSIYRQRDIVLVPFPFSDLSSYKRRPVLIVSNDLYNQSAEDIVGCALTTNLRLRPYAVLITPADVEEAGSLRHRSAIRADGLARLDQSLILRPIARLKRPIFDTVVSEIQKLMKS